MNRIGERIKKSRQDKGFTAKSLASKLGVSESFILDIETGKKIVSEDHLNRLSKILGVNLNDTLLSVDSDDKNISNSEDKRAPKKEKSEKSAATLPQWEEAFSSILKDVPVYDMEMKKIIDVRKLAVINNKIEGFPPEKVFYVYVDNNEMDGFRITKGDIVFIHASKSITDSGFYLVDIDGVRKIRQVKPLDKNNILLIAQGNNNLYTETVSSGDMIVLGKCIKAEITLSAKNKQ